MPGLSLLPAKLGRKSSMWGTTGRELVQMQLIPQVKGILKPPVWITALQLARLWLAQAWHRHQNVSSWHWSYPTLLSAAGVLPAAEAQHNLPVASSLSGNSLDANLINNKVLPP